MREIDLPVVKRVRFEGGSDIEPAFDQSWSEDVKAAWRVACTALDTGTEFKLFTDTLTHNGKLVPYTYSPFVGGSTCGAFDSDRLWDWLWGFETGIRVARS